MKKRLIIILSLIFVLFISFVVFKFIYTKNQISIYEKKLGEQTQLCNKYTESLKSANAIIKNSQSSIEATNYLLEKCNDKKYIIKYLKQYNGSAIGVIFLYELKGENYSFCRENDGKSASEYDAIYDELSNQSDNLSKEIANEQEKINQAEKSISEYESKIKNINYKINSDKSNISRLETSLKNLSFIFLF